jgi:hypothetical protein
MLLKLSQDADSASGKEITEINLQFVCVLSFLNSEPQGQQDQQQWD